MARKKKVKLLDTLIESFKKKWADASIRDLIYLISYFATVGLAYKILMKATGIIIDFNILEWFKIIPTGTSPEFDETKFNEQVLLTSFAVAYIVLKIDLDDVVAISSKITTVVSSLG